MFLLIGLCLTLMCWVFAIAIKLVFGTIVVAGAAADAYDNIKTGR